jgi:copper homeostasis protein
MAKILEVIVTSEDEALEAEAGGADRLELVTRFELGGLTPDVSVVERVLRKVHIPVRVMLRETPTLQAGTESDLKGLSRKAAELATLPIHGLVLGFVAERELDLASTQMVLAGAPQLKATFHKAFEEAADPLRAIKQLKELPQVDRILTTGGAGSWAERRERLDQWQSAAGDQVRLLVGAGLCECVLAGLREDGRLMEAHVGRAARTPRTVDGKVRREQVAALKRTLG